MLGGEKILKSGPLRVHLQHCGAKLGQCLNRTKTTLNSGFSGGGGGCNFQRIIGGELT